MNTPWTPMRAASAIGAGLSIAAAVTIPVASLSYTGQAQTNAVFWLAIASAIVTLVSYAAADTRDTVLDRETQLHNNIIARLEALELMVADYGDRREVSGHITATKVRDIQTRPR